MNINKGGLPTTPLEGVYRTDCKGSKSYRHDQTMSYL